jgi:hypothetical protein
MSTTTKRARTSSSSSSSGKKEREQDHAPCHEDRTLFGPCDNPPDMNMLEFLGSRTTEKARWSRKYSFCKFAEQDWHDAARAFEVAELAWLKCN